MSSSVTHSTDTFYGILCSGITAKTNLSFTSSNSSFSECVRKHHICQSNTITYQDTENNIIVSAENHHFENATETVNNNTHTSPGRVRLTASATFMSCEWKQCSAGHGGGIFFLSTGTLTVKDSSFTSCSSNDLADSSNGGGGAIFANNGSLSVTSTTFVDCTAKNVGGGVTGTLSCTLCRVSLSRFLCCTARSAGGLATFHAPKCELSSTLFLSCSVPETGGGMFHNGDNTYPTASLSESLFKDNSADFANTTGDCPYRGGGACEDGGKAEYTITFLFCFFTGNTAPKGVGSDISIQRRALAQNNINYCFTTATSGRFWNKDKYVDTWLPQGSIYFADSTMCGSKARLLSPSPILVL